MTFFRRPEPPDVMDHTSFLRQRLSPAGWLLFLLFGLVALRAFSLGLYPLMDTTEARYAEMSRKMLETGLYLFPQFDYGVPFWGKPPLSFWASAATMRLFGVSAFGARLASLLFALMTMGLLSAWPDGRARQGDPKSGIFSGPGIPAVAASIVFLSSAVGFVAAGAVMTDMALTFSTTICMVAFANVIAGGTTRLPWKWLFFGGLGLGLLAKGPVAVVLVVGAAGMWTLHKRAWRQVWPSFPWVRGALLVLVLTLPWYALVELRTPGFLKYFFLGEHWARFTVPDWQGDLYGSAHLQPRGTIWLYGAVAALPWTFILPVLCWRARGKGGAASREDTVFLLTWILAPLLLFTFARNILPAYVLPGLPAFALLTARRLAALPALGQQARRVWWIPALCGLAVLVVLPLCSPLMAGRSQERLLQHWDRSTPLVYLETRPFSGQFYSSGKARLAESPQEIAHWLSAGPATLALREATLERQGLALPPGWRKVAASGEWILVQNGHSLAAAPTVSDAAGEKHEEAHGYADTAGRR